MIVYFLVIVAVIRVRETDGKCAAFMVSLRVNCGQGPSLFYGIVVFFCFVILVDTFLDSVLIKSSEFLLSNFYKNIAISF